jgi:hypothetical protein
MQKHPSENRAKRPVRSHTRPLLVRPHGTRTPRLESAAVPRSTRGMTEGTLDLAGGCTCRAVRYRMTRAPLIVHCCHCRWCQRETGSAFVLNALVEAEHVTLTDGQVDVVHTPSNSGKGQRVSRCPTCRIAVWSNYAGAGEAIRFVRIGTLDEPDRLPPDVHIFTASKQPWVVIPAGARAFEEYYQASTVWSAESLARRAILRERTRG